MSIDTDISLWLSVGFIILGLYVLTKSADMFVDASAGIARYFGISPLIVGMVIIGFGTSAPELAVSAISASGGHPSLSLGNAYGSCIFNIAGILGIIALIKPILVKPSVNAIAVPILLFVSGLSYFLLYDKEFSRCDGIILLSIFVVLLPIYCWYDQKSINVTDGGCSDGKKCQLQNKRQLLKEFLIVITGLLLLVTSSHVLVWGCVDFARDVLGVSDLLIGLTIVAVGTSLPELASAIVSVRKGENEFVVGNIIGSNLFNSLAVVGIAGAISPFNGFSRYILLRDLPLLIILTVSIAVFSLNYKKIKSPGTISRKNGLVWVLLFIVYSIVMILEEIS